MKEYKVSDELRNVYMNTVLESVRIFESKYKSLAESKPHLYQPLSKEALYNHALSLLDIEFFKLGEEDRAKVLEKFL